MRREQATQAEPVYPKIRMFIAGEWTEGGSDRSEKILNPATGQPVGETPYASRGDLDRSWPRRRALRFGERLRPLTDTGRCARPPISYARAQPASHRS